MKNENREVTTSRNGIANVFREFYGKFYDDEQYHDIELEYDKNWDWKQHRRSRHRYERDERNSWYDDWRVARCNQQTQKKVNQQTAMESDPKTSKHSTKKRKRWWDRSSTRYKKKTFTPEAWQNYEGWRVSSTQDHFVWFFFDLEHVAFFVSHYSGFLVFVLSFQKVGKLMCSCSIPQEIWGHPKDGVERLHEMNCSNPHFDCPIMASLVHCLICTSELCLIFCLNLIQSRVKSSIHSCRKQFEQCKQIADRVIVSNIVSVTFFVYHFY